MLWLMIILAEAYTSNGSGPVINAWLSWHWVFHFHYGIPYRHLCSTSGMGGEISLSKVLNSVMEPYGW